MRRWIRAAGHDFKYSDINFITLGALVEEISGQSLDVYAQEHIFRPLGMTHTRYLPAKACGPMDVYGSAIAPPATDVSISILAPATHGTKWISNCSYCA